MALHWWSMTRLRPAGRMPSPESPNNSAYGPHEPGCSPNPCTKPHGRLPSSRALLLRGAGTKGQRPLPR